MTDPNSSDAHWVEISSWLCKRHLWVQDLPCWLMALLWLWVTTRPGGEPEILFWGIGIGFFGIISCCLIWVSCHLKIIAISETHIRLTSPYTRHELIVPHSSLIRIRICDFPPGILFLWFRNVNSAKPTLYVTQRREKIEEFRGRIHPEVVLNNIIAVENKKREEAVATIDN